MKSAPSADYEGILRSGTRQAGSLLDCKSILGHQTPRTALCIMRELYGMDILERGSNLDVAGPGPPNAQNGPLYYEGILRDGRSGVGWVRAMLQGVPRNIRFGGYPVNFHSKTYAIIMRSAENPYEYYEGICFCEQCSYLINSCGVFIFHYEECRQ